jgi:hypothetical protein
MFSQQIQFHLYASRHLMARKNPESRVFTNDKCFSSPYKVFNRYSPVSPKDFAAHRLKLLSRMAS